jgi:D-alanyl-D-alanine carboxypeptidase/D-alanyl-D-alanine-endopeptidase (penicillin-binding protein 4)
MYRSLVISALCVVLLVGAVAVRPASARSLSQQIGSLLLSPQLRGAQVGICLAEMGDHGIKPIYELNADVPLMPGSNGKLLTTSAAFARLGASAVIKTRLYKVGNNLVIVGGGDPAFGDPVLCQRAGWKVTQVFHDWANQLKKDGVTQINHIYIDDSIFNHHFFNPKWPTPASQRLDWYEAEVGGLNFAMNCVQWAPRIEPSGAIGVKLIPDTSYTPVSIQAQRGNSESVWFWRPPGANTLTLHGIVNASTNYFMQVTIHDPGLYTGAVFRHVLREEGITVAGGVVRKTLAAAAADGHARLVAVYQTPLVDILHRANTDSINLMAECLCKLLGHLATGQPGSWANGDAAIMAYLKSIGIDVHLVHMVDGSGLSHHDHIAPSVLVEVLAHDLTLPHARVFVDSLCRPGHGTLIYRFRGSPAAAHIRAKDGHVTGASTISGYLWDHHHTFVFSVMVNHYIGNVNGWEDQVIDDLYRDYR